MKKRRQIGEIFVQKGLITRTTLERALTRAVRQKKKIGFVLEEIEVITGDELAAALAEQFGYKVIKDFARFKYPPAILDIIPSDIAMQYLLFPLKIEGGRLALAVADPTETRIVSNIAANHRLTVVPFVATRNDIIAAINRHYLGKVTPQRKEPTVMLAEDNQLLATMLKNTLTKEGFRVVGALDGMEAYKAALTELPHVIITDREMPKLDGYSLFDALRNVPETRSIPIILLTSKADGDEEARAFEKGFFDFLAKPVKEVTLVTRVKRAFQTLEGNIAGL